MRASLGLWMGLALVFTACGGGGEPTSGDAGAGPTGGDDAGAADLRTPAVDSSAPDAQAGLDAMTGGGDAPADAPQGGTGDVSSDVAADTLPGADAVLDATSDAATDAAMAGPGDARPDVAAACSPAPDQRGFYSGCSACPSPGDCETIDVNGIRRYACGCSSPCPCNLHCGSYVIPGTGISISSICVR